MSSSDQYNYFRSWMDKPHQIPDTGLVTEEFREGLQEFMALAAKQKKAKKTGKIYCPCSKCRNRRLIVIDEVWSHLYCHGFVPGYKIWYNHGENDTMVDNYASTSEQYIGDSASLVEPAMEVESNVGHVQMVNDAFCESMPSVAEYRDRKEEPNAEARKFFDMLDAAKNPLYDGCRGGHSPLSAATRMMGIKTDFNLSEECVDAIAAFVKDILLRDNIIILPMLSMFF